jgi:APA family basic amino acid/polyamine antiporter
MTGLGLKRVLRLPEVTFIAIGTTIGGGVFVFTGIVYKIVGQGLPIAYALAVIPVFISMMPLAMLGSAIPTVGGSYKYPSRMVSPCLAFVGIWIYAIGSFFGGIPLYAISCATYAQAIFPNLHPKLFAICLVTVLLIINLYGVKFAAQVQGILVLILLSALLFFSFSGFPEIKLENFSSMLEKGSGNLFLGTALLTFTYFGSNGIIELGGEIKNPGKTIPRAFFIAFPIIAFVYISVSITTVGVSSITQLQNYEEPLIGVCRAICNQKGVVFFIVGGAILALITTLNALFIYGTKSLLLIVDDKILPENIGKINKSFGTPHILLTIIWILSILGIITGFSLQTLASYAALGNMIVFFPTMLASIKLPVLYPEQYKRSDFKLKGSPFWFCPIIGIIMVGFFGLVLIIDLKSPLKIGFFFVFIISGIFFYQIRKRYLLARGFDLESKIKTRQEWDG